MSKTLMYDFHYNEIEKMYDNKAKLLFADTDSLCCEIQTKDAFKDLWAKKGLFDSSDMRRTVLILIQQTKKCRVNSKINAPDSQLVI